MGKPYVRKSILIPKRNNSYRENEYTCNKCGFKTHKKFEMKQHLQIEKVGKLEAVPAMA